MTRENDEFVVNPEQEDENPDWDRIAQLVDRRATELNDGKVTDTVWTWREYGTDDVRSTDEIIAQFEEDVLWMAEKVKTDYPQARNLRWNWLIRPADCCHVFHFTLYLEVTFET